MKKMLKFALATMFAFLPLAAMAQQTVTANVISFGIGGPSTFITVTKGTNDNSTFLVNIAGKSGIISGNAESFRVRIGAFSNHYGAIPIFITACSGTEVGYHFNDPPLWSTDTGNFPSVALTKEFLTSHPSRKEVEQRVDGIKRTLHGQLGSKLKEDELKEWLRTVKQIGISTERTECANATPLNVLTFNWSGYNSYGGNQETMLTITKDRAGIYGIANPPRWVY